MFVKTQLPSFEDLPYLVPGASALDRQLARTQAQMALVGGTCSQGMDILSNLQGFLTFKTLNTLSGTALLVQAAELQGPLAPELQLHLAQMNNGYLLGMTALQQVAAREIIGQVAAAACAQKRSPSLIDRIRGR